MFKRDYKNKPIMLIMRPADSREFVKQGISPFKQIFTDVTVSHTPSGKSKLIICRKI